MLCSLTWHFSLYCILISIVLITFCPIRLYPVCSDFINLHFIMYIFLLECPIFFVLQFPNFYMFPFSWVSCLSCSVVLIIILFAMILFSPPSCNMFSECLRGNKAESWKLNKGTCFFFKVWCAASLVIYVLGPDEVSAQVHVPSTLADFLILLVITWCSV